jgi:SNF2 family DNA or RNA helicase
VRLGLGATDKIEGLPVEGVEYDGWLNDWMKRLTGDEKLTPLPQPQSLQGQLRPYQQYGYSWLDFMRRWGMGACLADDMGLGKTVKPCDAAAGKEEAASCRVQSVNLSDLGVFNWAKEVERFAPSITTLMHQGAGRLRGGDFTQRAGEVDMVLTSYAIARRDSDTLKKIDWFGVILDEAQNIKNPEAKQTRAIRQLPAQFRLALTGTPSNRLTEL